MEKLVVSSLEDIQTLIEATINGCFDKFELKFKKLIDSDISNSPKYYTRKQAAFRLGVSIPMIDKLVSTGRLQRKKIGSKTVFEISDIENLVN